MNATEPIERRGFLTRLGALGASVTGVTGAATFGEPAQAQATPSTVHNVRTYGARGDNRTDDTAPIRRAIAAASSALQSVVYFPAGNYRITGTLALADGTALIGDGLDWSVIRHRGPGNAISIVGTGTSQRVKTSLRDISVFGDERSSDVGLQLAFAPYGFYQNVRVSGFRLGVAIRSSWNLTFEQVGAESSRQDGWYFGVDANNIGMRNCAALRNARAGFLVAGSRGLALVDCDAEENGTGVVIAAASGVRTEKVSLLGGYYEGNATEEVLLRSDDGKLSPKAVTLRDVYFVRVDHRRSGRAPAVRVLAASTLLVDGCHFSALGDGYANSLRLEDNALVSGIVWGAGNLDESAGGRSRGRGTAYSVVTHAAG